MRRANIAFLSLFLCHVVFAQSPLSPTKAELATEAYQILEDHCAICHGKAGRNSGEMLLDYSKLVGGDEPFIVKGKVDESGLYKIIADGDMPPKRKRNPVPVDKLEKLKKWIEAGAPPWVVPPPKREFINNQEISRRVLEDLKKQPLRNQKFIRYYTLTHLYNAGELDNAMENYRSALAKLINSLSWERYMVKPIPIDAEKTILRIDLRDLDWGLSIWKKIINQYPYGAKYKHQSFKEVCDLTDATTPFIRADWFIANAALPPLYHEILKLPETDKELEAYLRVNVALNLEESPGLRVLRSGFLISGVSKFNRIVERHRSRYGAYWKSYDFDSNIGLKNIFKNPLNFKQAGGEIIFNLPNGLLAYLLVGPQGERIDKAPIDIVFSSVGDDPVIRNGLSCMACHTKGIKEFKDRAGELHMAIKKTKFADATKKDDALTLYPSAEKMNELVKKDVEVFKKAVGELGGEVGGREPIVMLAERYKKAINPKLAAAELGLDEPVFLVMLNNGGLDKLPEFNALAAGVAIARETWEKNFSKVTPLAEKYERFLWEFATGGGVHSSPAIGTDGTVYIGSDDKKVYALNGKTGAKKWEFETGGVVRSSPAIGADGTVYVGSDDKKVYALDGETGTKKWEFETGGIFLNSTPAIGVDGVVYVAPNFNKVYALEANGTKKWEYKTDSPVTSSPAIGASGVVYIGSEYKKVYALNSKTEAEKWQFTIPARGSLSSSPAVDDNGTIYIGAEDGKVYALDDEHGVLKWSFQTGKSEWGVNSSPAIGNDGTVYVGSDDKKVYALDGKFGTKKWEFETGNLVRSSPAIGADGTLYIGSLDNKVYALDGKTGAKQWEFETAGAVHSSPTIGADGTLFVGSVDGKVYAFKTESPSPAKSPWPMRGQNARHTGRTIKKK